MLIVLMDEHIKHYMLMDAYDEQAWATTNLLDI
jgi:hypothetical protein